MRISNSYLPAVVLGAALVVPGTAAAQQPPDFSGAWSMAAAPPPAPGARPAPVLGRQIAIRHDGQYLSITRTILETTVTMAHVLDGSQTRTRMPARLCEGDSESIYEAGWDGRSVRISLVGTVPPGGGAVLTRALKWTLRLDSPDTLTVEMVAEAAGQTPPRTMTTAYKRTGDAAPPPTSTATVQSATATIAQLDWLGGVWIGTAGANQVEERWTPPAGGSMLAVARSLRGGLMTSFEFLCITERDGGLVYTAMPNGRQPPTHFTLTRIDDSGATFENPAHDFPKMIRYTRKPDGTLEAVVSGDGKQRPLTFVFRKQ